MKINNQVFNKSAVRMAMPEVPEDIFMSDFTNEAAHEKRTKAH
jgi:hypothetical protein